jgi:BASS family bile acid:Na+ symporter
MAALLHLVEKLSVFTFLVASMLAMGLNFTPRAVLAPLRRARLVVLALALNFVLAPAFAWLITFLIPLERGHVIGMLLLGGAAGAPFLPKLVEAARGDLAVAVSLMVLLTVGTILFLPFALPLMIPGFTADPWPIARPLVLLIALPLVVGMLLKSRAGRFAARAAPILAKIGSAALLLLFALLIVLNIPALLGVLGSGAILAAVCYVLGLFGMSWLLGALVREARAALALGTCARNFGAALVPAASSFDDPNVMIMLIVSAIVGLVASFAAAVWVRKRTSPFPA